MKKTPGKIGRGGSKSPSTAARRSFFLPLLALWLLAIVVLSGLVYWGEGPEKISSKQESIQLSSSPVREKGQSSSRQNSESKSPTTLVDPKDSSSAHSFPFREEPAKTLKPLKPEAERDGRATPSARTSVPAKEDQPAQKKSYNEIRNSIEAETKESEISPPPESTPDRVSAKGDASNIPPKPRTSEKIPVESSSESNLTNDASLPPFKPITPSREPPVSVSSPRTQQEESHPPKENLSLALHIPEGGQKPALKPPSPPVQPLTAPVAKVAIVIDDFGQDLEMAQNFLKIPLPLTFSILPYQRHSREIAKLVHDHHHEVILHLPMEPQGYPKTNPGEGALLLSMSEKKIQDTLESAIDSSFHISGVNNHMGSRFTENRDSMKILIRELSRRNLYFLDSYTSPRSVGMAVARDFHVPTARRDIFLDHVTTEDFTRSQINQLIRKAKIEGTAIAIGHPHESTLRVLLEASKLFEKEAIAVVSAGELMKNHSSPSGK